MESIETQNSIREHASSGIQWFGAGPIHDHWQIFGPRNEPGKTRTEEAQVDMVVDCIIDLIGARIKAVFEKDEKKKAELMEKLKKETVPGAMANLEAILAKNGGKFMVGNDVSLQNLTLLLFQDEPCIKFQYLGYLG